MWLWSDSHQADCPAVDPEPQKWAPPCMSWRFSGRSSTRLSVTQTFKLQNVWDGCWVHGPSLPSHSEVKGWRSCSQILEIRKRGPEMKGYCNIPKYWTWIFNCLQRLTSSGTEVTWEEQWETIVPIREQNEKQLKKKKPVCTHYTQKIHGKFSGKPALT